jgi:hypothetical protein
MVTALLVYRAHVFLVSRWAGAWPGVRWALSTLRLLRLGTECVTITDDKGGVAVLAGTRPR